jgi:hypothetical protein
VLAASATPAFAAAPAAAPSGLTAVQAINGVRLTWTSVPGALSFDVLRGTTADDLAVIGSTTQTSYGDKIGSSTALGTSYVYEVRAVNTDGAGPASAPASASTPAVETVPTGTQVAVLDGADQLRVVSKQTDDVFAPKAGPGWVEVQTSNGLGYAVRISMGAPTGQAFAPGDYPLATSTDATHGSIYATEYGFGCTPGEMTGTLHVAAAGSNVDGQLALLDADARYTCGDGAPRVIAVRIGSDRGYDAVAAPNVDPGFLAADKAHTTSATYTNAGSVPVTVTGAAVSGGSWTASGENTCTSAVLQPGQACHVGLSVTPGKAQDSGTITYTDSTLRGSHTRRLSVIGVTTPAAPTQPVATRNGGKVTLQWSDGGGDYQRVASYRVLRGADPASLALIATVPEGPTHAYTDPDVSDGHRVYAIEAVNDAGTSPASTPLVLDLGASAPTGLTAAATVTKTSLAWQAPASLPADPIVGYAVYRGTSAAALSQVGTVSSTSWTTTAPAPGAHAFFAVAAQTAAGVGPRTAVVDVVGSSTQLVVGEANETQARVAVLPVSGGRATDLVNDGHAHFDIAVQPNGTYVAYTLAAIGPNGPGQGNIYMRKVDGSTPAAPIAFESYDEYNPAWSPDGKQISYSREDGTICRAAVTSTGAGPCVPITQDGYDDASWLSTNTLVVANYNTATAPLARITTAGVATPISGTAGGYQPSVSPDGTQVAYLAEGSSDFSEVIKVITLSTGAVRTLAAPSGMFFSTPSWSRDMSALYVSGMSESSSGVYRIATAGGPATTVTATTTGAFFGVGVSTPDLTAPVNVKLAGIPAVTLGTTVTPTFSAGDALNKVASYTLSYRRAAYNGGYSAPTTKVLTKATPIAIAKGYSYCFSVRATDRAGNTSAATPEQCVMVPLDDRSLARSSGFAPVANSAYFAGTAMKTTGRGQTLTRTGMTAMRQLTVIGTACATCGTVDVLVAGRKVGAVNFASRTTVNRKAFTLPAFSVRNGTVVLKVTSTGKTVVIDGLGFRK